MVKVVTQQPAAPAAPDAPAGGVDSIEAILSEVKASEQLPQQQQQEQQQQEQQQQAATTAQELLSIAKMVRGMALPLAPEAKRARIAQAWTDEVLKNASEAWANVMAMHGWTVGEALGKYGPYMALAASLAPPVLVTVQIIKEPETQQPEKIKDGQQQQA